MSVMTNHTFKTREELIADFENELIELHGMQIEVEGGHEPLVYSRDMELMPQRLYFILPEYSTYHLTIHYKVPGRVLNDLRYSQTVKKHGVTFNSRKEKLHNDVPGEIHSIRLAPEKLPGGALVRGIYPAHSKFKEGKKTILDCPWTIEIAPEGTKAQMGGFI